MELSIRSGTATPGATGVVILKVWAEAVVTTPMTTAVTASHMLGLQDIFTSSSPFFGT
jgi:hypothetical protein